MSDKEDIQTSKFLSLVPRHALERAGLKLESTGEMHRAGHIFCRSADPIRLADYLQPQFI